MNSDLEFFKAEKKRILNLVAQFVMAEGEVLEDDNQLKIGEEESDSVDKLEEKSQNHSTDGSDAAEEAAPVDEVDDVGKHG